MENLDNRDLYRIGTVASLTGISVERLRAWERRYNLSPAHKAGKTRFYSRDQLERLKLIKRLIDQGQPISTLATLDSEQLRGRLELDEKVIPIGAGAEPPQVGLIGANLLGLEQRVARAAQPQRLDVVARWSNLEAFETELEHLPELAAIVLQLPTLSSQPIDLIKDILPDVDVFVVYQFATSQMISSLTAEGVELARWPLSWREIEHSVIRQRGFHQPGRHMVPRRYSDEELIAIAAGSTDPSRCIDYFVESIHQLNALASFTEECQENLADPERYQQPFIDITQARAQLETALGALLQD
ncbi:MAG: MerR family transcriptional regulator [Pseudomonadota bacterium]